MTRLARTTVAAALMVLAFACSDGSTQSPVARTETPDFSAADAAIHSLIEEGALAGAVLAVVHRDTLVHLEAQGSMDLESGEPMRTDAIVRIFSMTKPITTAAALMLVEERKLGLDDRVTDHLPVLAGLEVDTPEGPREPARPMTVRDLMCHTSGFTYGLFGDTAVDALYRESKVLESDDLAAMLEKLSGLPLVCAPGRCWNYGVSTDVLGRLVEVASGQSLDRFFDERIFGPLGMVDTGFSVPKEKLDRLASLHVLGEEGLQHRASPGDPSEPPGLLSGGGGLYSTATDYLRFLRMIARSGELDGVRLLQTEIIAEMTRNQLAEELVPIAVTEPLPGVGFGLGFAVRLAESEEAPGAAVGDYYWDGLASTHAWVSPEHELIVVTLEQTFPFSSRTADAVREPFHAAVAGKGAVSR